MKSIQDPIGMPALELTVAPTAKSGVNRMESQNGDSRWLEISARIACWIGILGLIALILQMTWQGSPHFFWHGAWAVEAHRPGTGGATNPFSNTGPDHQAPGGAGGFGKGFFDDEDDDDDDDAPMAHPSGAHGLNQNSGMGGNTPHNASSFNSNAHGPGGSAGASAGSGSGSGFGNNPGSGFGGAGARPQFQSGSNNTPRSYSAGGTPASALGGNTPVITDKGISVGGGSANGVVANNRSPLVHIDDETAEGSKDVVTDFNFPDADIMDIAKTLGKLTGKNFILDKDVKGKITIISNSAITVGEAWKVFLTALDINGFALIPSGKYLRISRQRDARDKQLKTYTGDFSPDTDALITRVFPLKYISSEEVARTFRSFMPANSRIIPYEGTNTVIVTDTGSNISKLAKMLDILDVEGYDAGIEVVPVKYASAAELSKLIDALIPGTAPAGPGGGQPGGMPRFSGGPGGGKFSARRTKEGGIINTIIADERTNTLIVHANTRGADQVRELVAKLDQKLPSSTGGGKVHVVYLQFADSEQIANTLNNFSSQTGSTARPAGGAPGTGAGTGVNPISANLFEGSIKISPDKATNALVITASPSDFVTVKRVINQLDIPREQVYVEVVIMEVQLGRSFNFSSNILSAPSLLGSITSASDAASMFTGNPFTSAGGLMGYALGNPYTLNVNGQQIQVSSVQGLIKAVQGNTNTNILSTPQIIALDNSEATFESAEKIPFPVSNAVQGAGVQTSIQKESVATSIKIKPQINKITNFVKLDVTAKLGDIQNASVPKALTDTAFATLDRTATTTVVIGDSDTVVLGGLIRDKTSETIQKIPLLGDIPLLGWLFKSKISSVDKVNLLIFMTPHIIKQYEKVRAILDKKLRERDEFIETNFGGEDALRPQRDAMIRSLPDIKELNEKHPETVVTIDEEKPAAVPVAPAVPAQNPLSPTFKAPPAKTPAFNPEERAPVAAPPAAPPAASGSAPEVPATAPTLPGQP